ncbi:MAG: hypothetical protein GX144_05665 [Clostridiaceae bacterium]|jgi:hypothetical protein|nr:hypothetical protein [Clostridiaceae bacterium]
MNSILTDNSNAEHVISSKIDTFFANFSLGSLMKKSNFYIEGGFQCVVVLKSFWRHPIITCIDYRIRVIRISDFYLAFID